MRIPVKWIRDKAKGAYEKDTACYICASTEELELHHTVSMTLLMTKWAKENNFTDAQIVENRESFIETYRKEIYSCVFTLCSKHHKHLHRVFGQAPALSTQFKQEKWIQIQHDKLANREVQSSATTDSP